MLAPRADPIAVALQPSSARVEFRAYGLGLLPIDGVFERFSGQFVYDPSDRARCQVTLRVDIASLALPDSDIREEVLGPTFLDADAFPQLAFEGGCRSGQLEGMLAMHGVTHPFALSLEWHPGGIAAEGHLRRATWGMTARPFLAGSTLRVTVRARIP